jgi:hypothetical protein
VNSFAYRRSVSPVARAAITPVAAVATTSAAATVSAATTTTSSSTAAELAGRTLFARSRFIDGDCATFELRALQRSDRLLCILGRGHFDKRETARTPREPIGNQLDLDHGSVRAEHVLQILRRGGERDVSHVEFSAHCMAAISASSPFPTTGFQIITEQSLT